MRSLFHFSVPDLSFVREYRVLRCTCQSGSSVALKKVSDHASQLTRHRPGGAVYVHLCT